MRRCARLTISDTRPGAPASFVQRKQGVELHNSAGEISVVR
jgi:hypothetical protein